MRLRPWGLWGQKDVKFSQGFRRLQNDCSPRARAPRLRACTETRCSCVGTRGVGPRSREGSGQAAAAAAQLSRRLEVQPLPPPGRWFQCEQGEELHLRAPPSSALREKRCDLHLRAAAGMKQQFACPLFRVLTCNQCSLWIPADL